METGEGWFRIKNPRGGLEVETPAVTATIRGSEIDLKVENDRKTTLTVLEGVIRFYNDYGFVLVNPG